ncbi:MAG: hypothetical protein AAF597_12920, partial [Bacteroidota bacterium]
DEGFVIDNGQQNDDIRRYEVTFSGAGGFLGLPAADSYTQNEFETAFDNLTLTSISCDPATITMSIRAYYDRDNNMELSGAEECPGPITELAITVDPRPEPQATIGVEDEVSAVCEDDADVQFIVTGTPFTQVTYTVSFDGGATNGGPLTLDIDGSGVNTDIVLDANNGAPGDDIIVTLIGQEFTSGPACPITYTKPIVIGVTPLPTLSIELADPDDAIICNVADGGPVLVPLILRTTGPDGSYTFSGMVTRNGVNIQDFTFTATFTNGVNTNFFEDGFLGVSEEVELIIFGSSITYNDGTPPCTNDAPDAQLSFYVIPATEVSYEVTVPGGSSSLDEDSSPLSVTLCDEETISVSQLSPLTDPSSRPDIEGLVQVEVDDDDDLLGLGGTGTYTFNHTDNVFGIVDQVLDIPNSLTDPVNLSLTFTPYFEVDPLTGIENAECVGDPITLNIEVRPAPTVTAAVSAPDVCAGETVTVTITASEPGTANLIINSGGAPIAVDVQADNGDGTFSGTWMSDPLTAMTQFTVTTFLGDVANCAATVNQMVMTDVEDNPDGEISDFQYV